MSNESRAPRAKGGPQKEQITWQDWWDTCDVERTGALAWHDMHASKGNAEQAARFKRRHDIFESLQIIVGRASDSLVIKDELAAIARREKLAAEIDQVNDGDAE